MKPRVKETVQIFSLCNGIYHIYDSKTQRHFKMGEQEVGWLRLLNGVHTMDSLKETIPAEHFDEFILRVSRFDLLEGSKSRPSLNIFKIKFPIIYPYQTMSSLKGITTLYRRILNASFPVLLMMNAILLLLLYRQLYHSLLAIRPGLWAFIFYFAVIILVGFIHEFSHAMVANSYGVNVPVVGMMLFYFHPAFYADISGIGLLSRREERLKVLLAGIMSNNLVISIAIVGYIAMNGGAPSMYYALCILMNILILLINLVPFVEYDGYFILLELFDEPDFMANARTCLRNISDCSFEYFAYLAISRIFSGIMIFTAINSVRLFVLKRVSFNYLDQISIAVMVITYAYLVLRPDTRFRQVSRSDRKCIQRPAMIWTYRLSVVVVVLATSYLRSNYHITIHGVLSLTLLFLSMPVLAILCGHDQTEMRRQIFCTCIIYCLSKAIVNWSLYSGFVLGEHLTGIDAWFSIIQRACFSATIIIIAITILFIALNVFMMMLYSIKRLRRFAQ